MSMIMALIDKNPLTSVTSLKNLEISQCSSDVPMLVNFSIYMSHFTYMCKMRCPLNLVLENSEYLWFY